MKSADARQIDLDSRMVAKSRQKSCKQTQNPFISGTRRPRGMKLAQEILKKRRERLKNFLWAVLRLDGARPCTRKAWHRCSRDKWSIPQELGRKRLGPTVEIPANRYEKEHQRFDCGHLGCVQLKTRSYSVPQRATNCRGVTWGMESLRPSSSARGPRHRCQSETKHCSTVAPRHALPPPLEIVIYRQWTAAVEKQPKGQRTRSP